MSDLFNYDWDNMPITTIDTTNFAITEEDRKTLEEWMGQSK